jgi:hypothetical protein
MMTCSRCLVTVAQNIVWGDQIKEDDVGGTCSTHGGGERCLRDFGWEARRKVTTGKTWAQVGG